MTHPKVRAATVRCPLGSIGQSRSNPSAPGAVDDIDGAEGAERIYGGYFRNAHLWDVE